MFINRINLMLLLCCSILTRGQSINNINLKRQVNEKKSTIDIESIRDDIFASRKSDAISRDKTKEILSEINLVKESILKSSVATSNLSQNLTKVLKQNDLGLQKNTPIVGIEANEAISNPNINVIDYHLEEIVNPNVLNDFEPNVDEIKQLTKMRHSESKIHNLYRENLVIRSISEEVNFKIGTNIEQWKTLALDKETALIGKFQNNILLVIGSNASYQIINEMKVESKEGMKMCIETFFVWDHVDSKMKNILLVAVDKDLIWYELDSKEFKEVNRWHLMKNIDKISYFQHEGSDIIMLTTTDNSKVVEVEFIEFNYQSKEFWVVQTFKLPNLPKSMVCLDAGKDLIVAFTQESHITIYRHQSTKFERGKFAFLKTIDAANVSVISGFRIGGYSYLAIGGDQPQILRYFNGDFHPQTILSQTFGHVEGFLPIPIKIYRDDLVLLVQHRIRFRTHSLVVVDALIWNGVAFESALSIPCNIAADPNANGFTCMLDYERDKGLLGSTFILGEKLGSFDILIPRHDTHSGLYRIEYEIVEAEDPLIKEMEQIKKAIELINGMLDIEASVKNKVDEALMSSINPKNDFTFENIFLDEIEADTLHFDGNVEIESDRIEFLDKSYDREDFIANLQEIEKTLFEDEQKLKRIDGELNRLIRKNRQIQQQTQTKVQTDSPITYLGPYTFNGQLDAKTIRVLPQNNQRRIRRQVEPIDEANLKNLNTKNIIVNAINGIPIDDFLFLKNGELHVPEKNIIFEDSVRIKDIFMSDGGKVNNIDFSQEVLAIDSLNFPHNLSLENVIVQNLEVNKINHVLVDSTSLQDINVNFDDNLPPIFAKRANMLHNLNVEKINDVNWNDFMKKLILKDQESSTENLTINGNIWMIDDTGDISVDTLNDLSFPSEYVLKSGPPLTIISGKKVFTESLVTNAIDTGEDGTLNDIKPSEMITLNRAQNISSANTFNVMEVIKKLEVHGTIAGQKLDEFLPNPTIETSNEILAACSFKELIVEGTIEIEESLNNDKLENILADIVYDNSEEETIIQAQKTFTNLDINGNAVITNNFISNIKLDNIMTSDSSQVVKFDKLHGDIYFTHLRLSGLFDEINATVLEMNSVRTFGDQFVETPITVLKTRNNQIDAVAIEIKKRLNVIPIDDYYLVDQPIEFQIDAAFSELNANNANIKDNINGVGSFVNVNLNDLILHRLSKSLNQNINSPIEIKKLITNDTFDGTNINNIPFRVFKNYMKNLKNYKTLMLSGNQKLDSLIIDGDINLKNINDWNFESIINNVIWLNRPNIIQKSMKFLDEIELNSKLYVEGNINKKSVNHFLENWISKNEKPLKIHAEKFFKKDIFVEENLETLSINNIKYENILKNLERLELSQINIIGFVKTKNLIVNNNFNKVYVKVLDDHYIFDSSSNLYIINSDVHFQKVKIDYLNTPIINKFGVKEWIDDLIRTNDSQVYISGAKIFKSDFYAEKGIHIHDFHGINIKDLIKNIVIFNSNEITNIHSNIIFEDDFYGELVALRGNISTDFISGHNLKEWLRNTVPIANGKSFGGDLRIYGSSLKVANINVFKLHGIPFEHFFTLHTNQTLNHLLSVNGTVDVKAPLILNGEVNGINLKHEQENTVMLFDTNQTIQSDVSLPGARILGSLTLNGLINSKNIEKIVVLNSSPVFDSSMTFTSLEVISLSSEYHISGLNFNKWYENVLWKNGKDEQIITGNWALKSVLLNENVQGNGLINSQPIKSIQRNLKTNLNAIEMAISDYSGQYHEMCQKLQYRADNLAKNSIYILRYFESDFKISEQHEIFSYFSFATNNNEHFLLVNTNCTTEIYKWFRAEEKFYKTGSAHTGVIYNWIKLNGQTNDEVYIVTNSKMEANAPCAYGGLNSWKLLDDKLILLKTISNEPDVLAIHVDGSNLNNFYTLGNSDHVINYDVFGHKIQQWKLPTENYTYNFLPSNLLPGLHLNNGRRIFSLKSKFLRRGRRFLWEDAPILKLYKNQTKTKDSPMYTFKMPEFPIRERERTETLPTIPSIPLKSPNKVDFLTKVRQAGEVIKSSFNLNVAKWNSSSKFVKTNVSNITQAPVTSNAMNDTKKLLFIIKSPNISSVKEKNVISQPILFKSSDESKKALSLNKHSLDKLQEVGKGIKDAIFSTRNDTIKSMTQKAPVAKPTKKSDIYSFTPRILMPPSEESFETTINNTSEEIVVEKELTVDSSVIEGSGVRDMENALIPEYGHGEITILYVGAEHKRPLYAVTRNRNSIIKGNDLIEIYSDIIEQKAFQYIQCREPSNILALHFRDETLLAFMESHSEVQIYIYRGVQGFTFFRNIQLSNYASHMSAVSLPPRIEYKCDQQFLVVQMDYELQFMKIKIDGNCGINHVSCNNS